MRRQLVEYRSRMLKASASKRSRKISWTTLVKQHRLKLPP